MASPDQVDWLRKLLTEKDIPEGQRERITAVLDDGAQAATVSEYIDELKFAPKATGAGARLQVKIYNGTTNWLAWIQREEYERITTQLAQHNRTRGNQPAVFSLDDGTETTISSIEEFRPKK